MIYRKNIILAIVESFGGEVSATDFQKLLFLFSEQQKEKNFDFVPYKFGCFSFQTMADKNKLIKEGYLENTKSWKAKSSKSNFRSNLKESDRKILTKLKAKFGHYSTNDLIRYIYINFPYYAINSEIAFKFLTREEFEIIEKLKPKNEEQTLFTIGYEGKSIEQYLNILIQQNIKVLCDVRKNPLSRKYGFAKRTLQKACESVNIKYLHLPELGIVSEKRKNLKSQNDYDLLFFEYENTILSEQKKVICFISSVYSTYGRIALTCYESSPKQCHRTRVANAVLALDNEISICHL